MSGRRRQSLSPSLFPFLAVLVCTLGTLILLLALVAQNATETAEQNARAQQRVAEAKLKAAEAVPAPPRMTAKAVDSMISEQRFRFEQLVAFRDKQTADLEQRRDQLTHLEDHVARLRQKLERLSNEIDNAMGETHVKEIDDEIVAQLRASIDAERAAVEKLRSDSARKTPRVVIVPHKGPNGTDRRPVYLECDAQGVTIWPEGSRITITQLDDSTHSANPLDAALRAVRYHAMQNYGDTTPPYPLLVVRPDGIETYGAARKAMLDWDDQFGYELVPADVKLAFAKPDANLKQRLEIAIREAAAKQYAHNAIARRTSTGNATNGRSGTNGRGTAASKDRSRGRMPTLSAASLDRSGRASGFRSAGDDYRAGSTPFGRSPYTSSPPSTAGSRYGSQTGDAYSSGTYNGGPYGGSYANMDPSASTRELANQMRTAAREMRDQQASNSQSPGKDAGFSASTADAANDGATASDKNGPNQNGPNQDQLAENTGNPSEGPSQGEISVESSLTTDPSVASQTETQTQDSLAQAASQQGSSPQTAASGSQRSSGSQSSAPMTTQPGSSSTSTEQQQMSAAPPQVSFDATPRRKLVQRQGRDWALPPSMAGMGGNSIVRTIRVQCYPDRLVLLPPSTGGVTEMFGFSDGNLDRASLELASAVRDRVDRWGAALPGGRWQPRLDVQVSPGGESRFHQLRSLMSGSGVEVTGRASQ
jgi:hypothetical protein